MRSGSPSRVTQAHERLEPPGPFTAIDETPDVEHATWLAFLLALAPELHDADRRDPPRVGGRRLSTRCPRPRPRPPPPTAPGSSAPARRRPRSRARRAGRPSAASAASSSASRSPASPARMRYDLLAALGAAGIYPLEADAPALRRGRRRRRRRQAAARLRRPDAARAPRPRPGRRVPSCRSARSTAASRCGARRRARRPDRRAGPGHRRRPRPAVMPWRSRP